MEIRNIVIYLEYIFNIYIYIFIMYIVINKFIGFIRENVVGL